MDRLTIGQAALAGVTVKTVRCSRLVCGPGRPWARCPRSRRYAERRTLASDISCESSGAAALCVGSMLAMSNSRRQHSRWISTDHSLSATTSGSPLASSARSATSSVR